MGARGLCGNGDLETSLVRLRPHAAPFPSHGNRRARPRSTVPRTPDQLAVSGSSVQKDGLDDVRISR